MIDDESRRLEALRAYRVLDTPTEPSFDRITALASAVFGVRACTLSLADRDRHWFKSRHGVDADEIPRWLSFCDHTIRGTDVFVVEDAARDPRFAQAPVVVGPPYVRFYAGAPLVSLAGLPIGSLCVLDTEPRAAFTSRDRSILVDLAATAVELLEARTRQVELKAMADEVAHLARHDPLTGLANRRRLREVMDDLAASDGPGQTHLALLYLDLDGFKAINDSYGHLLGDELLRAVAERLSREVADLGTVARLGGDEFAVLIAGDAEVDRLAVRLGDGLVRSLSRPFAPDGSELRLSASVGLAVGPSGVEAHDLFRTADAALYRAKANGRGRLVTWKLSTTVRPAA